MLYVSMQLHRLATRVKDESGAAMAEYGLLVALIAIAAIAGVTLLGTNLQARFNQVATAIGNAN